MFDRFIEIRKNFFKNQTDMASIFNVSKQTISDYERGRTFPKPDILEKLTTEYNINLNWLLTGKGNMLLTDTEKASTTQQIQELNNKIKELEIENKVLKELIKK